MACAVGVLCTATALNSCCLLTSQELNAGFPEEFASFLKYCRTLRFASDPDYTEIRAMFRRAAERLGVEYDNQYDWVIKNKTTPTGDEDESKSGR